MCAAEPRFRADCARLREARSGRARPTGRRGRTIRRVGACKGLHTAHALLSPHELCVTVDGVCKVLDVGVSKMTKDSARTRFGAMS